MNISISLTHSLIFSNENGHVLTPVLSNAAEASIYRQIIIEAAEKYNTEKRKLEERDTCGKAFCKS